MFHNVTEEYCANVIMTIVKLILLKFIVYMHLQLNTCTNSRSAFRIASEY